MTHTASHIILQALATPTPMGSKYKCWHVAALCALLGFVLGALVF